MNFGSDNWAGAAPEIMDALRLANDGAAPAYGADAASQEAKAAFNEIFEKEVAVYFVATGGAANGLALSVLTPPYGMIFAHEESHIQMDECAGPEFLTGGAKILPLPGFAAKLTPEAVERGLRGFPERPPHGAPAQVLSLTQATECGAVYTCTELTALCDTAHANGLKVHLDGARFANALATLGCSPAEMSWKAGVDVLCFGGTKNGCIAAEAIVFFNPSDAGDIEFRRKRAGHLWSKQRFISAQFNGYFKDGLWLRLAAQANARAKSLSKRLGEIDGVKVWYPTQANEVFASFPDDIADRLREAGATFYPWVTPGDPANGAMQRLICSYATTDEEIDRFIAAVRSFQ